MHIAICDDNVADRKQMERLLGRESDVRKLNTGVFYTDSYGMGSQMFSKRMSYDLFFIDLVEDTQTGLDFALELCSEGVSAPIVLCSSKLNYEESAKTLEHLPSNLLFMNKPIIKAELSAMLDRAVELEQLKVKKIELRHKTETYYVNQDDLVYAEQSNRYVIAYLRDGTEVPVLDNMRNFYDNLNGFTHFAFASDRVIVNVKYIESFSPFKVKLKSGINLKAAISYHSSLKKIYEYVSNEKD